MTSSSSAVATGVLPGQTQSYTLQGMNEEQRLKNDENIKRFAKTFLGHGCNETSSGELRVLATVVQDFTENDVDIRSPRSNLAVAIDSSEDLVTEELDRKCGFSLKVAGSVPIGASASVDTSKKSKDETNQFICAIRRLEKATCTFNRIPPVKEDLSLTDPQRGDSFVTSGAVYVGYELFFVITTDSHTNESSTHLAAEVNIPIKVVNLGFSAESLSKKLMGKSIKSIRVDVRGFGGYTAPIKPSIDTLVEIQGAADEVEQDFYRQFPSIRNRQFRIDSRCLTAYSYGPQNKLPGILYTGPVLPSFESLSTVPAISDHTAAEFDTLANKMMGSFSESYRATLDRVLASAPAADSKTAQMGHMLWSIEKVFSSTFEISPARNVASGYTEVIGDSGAGKSLLIGYLLGQEIVEKEMGLELVLDYKPSSNSRFCPVVGHSKSKTKGCKVYQAYIDTGGLIDTNGIETDICNAISISMITRERSPNRLLIVIDSALFNGRGQPFLKLIKTLKKCVRDLTDKNIWSSILFLINDRIPLASNRICSQYPTPEAFILAKIKKVIATEEAERDERLRLPKGGVFAQGYKWLKNTVVGEGFRKEIEKISQNNPNLAREILEYQENIEILELLTEENIVVVDFFGTTTREKILKWQKKDVPQELSRDDFTMEGLVNQSKTIFNTTLGTIATYFNNLFSEETSLMKMLANLKTEMESIQQEIRATEGSINFPSEPVEQVTQMKLRLAGDLKTRQDQVREIEEQIKRKTVELSELQQNENPEFLSSIQPDTPITPRSWWAWLYHRKVPLIQILDWISLPRWVSERVRIADWAYTYKFEYNGISVHHVEKIEPTKDKDYPGYYLDEDISQLVQGKYTVYYRPGYYGYAEDCQATVKIYVKKKDHPATKAKIEEITAALSTPDAGLKAQLAAKNANIARIEAHIGVFSTDID